MMTCVSTNNSIDFIYNYVENIEIVYILEHEWQVWWWCVKYTIQWACKECMGVHNGQSNSFGTDDIITAEYIQINSYMYTLQPLNRKMEAWSQWIAGIHKYCTQYIVSIVYSKHVGGRVSIYKH